MGGRFAPICRTYRLVGDAVLVATAWAVVPAGSKVFICDQARQALDVASQELNKAKY